MKNFIYFKEDFGPFKKGDIYSCSELYMNNNDQLCIMILYENSTNDGYEYPFCDEIVTKVKLYLNTNLSRDEIIADINKINYSGYSYAYCCYSYKNFEAGKLYSLSKRFSDIDKKCLSGYELAILGSAITYEISSEEFHKYFVGLLNFPKMETLEDEMLFKDILKEIYNKNLVKIVKDEKKKYLI